MQEANLEEFINSPGWEVVHNGDTQLYEIKNERGRRLSGRFTDRRFAEQHLFQYLAEMQRKNERPKRGPGRPPKED